MLLQKICLCFLGTLIACSGALAQSTPKVPLDYVGSFAYQLRGPRRVIGEAPYALRTSVYSHPLSFVPKAKRPGSVARAAAFGILGGVAGFVTGAFIGAGLDECFDGSEETILCNLDTAFYVGSAAGAAMMAVGVHVGNGRHGRFFKDLIVSVLIGGAGMGLAFAADSPAILISVPIAQLIGTIAMERKETPAK